MARLRPRLARPSRVVLVAILATAAVALPAGIALGSHQFSDVPNSNTFHDDIDAIADAGVTTGCGGGKYCPDSYVTRGQMAAFLNRLGALQAGKTPVVNATKVDGYDAIAVAAGRVVIPSGTTVTGYEGWDDTSAGPGDVILIVDLPGRAPVPLAVDHVNFAPSALADDDDATCTGTPANPTAPAGKVCLYEMNESNTGSAQGFNSLADGWEDRAFAVQFLVTASAGNQAFFYFSWAYTAP